MLSLLILRCLCFYFVLAQYIRAEWPSSNSSNIKLLGLFTDTSNISRSTTLARQVRAMFQAAIILSRQYNITIDGQCIGWQSVQTKGDVMNALSNTCSQVSTENIVGIVGPELSRESHSIALFAARIGIPVISFAATDPELSDRSSYRTFYRTVPSDNAAALALVDLFILYNWSSCIVIYQNDAFGSGGMKVINEVFNKNQLNVKETIVFDVSRSTIRGNLKQLLEKSSTRIVLLWATPNYTSLILHHALESDVVGPEFTWILSSNTSLDNIDRKFYPKLIGMFIIEPVVGNVVNAPSNQTLLEAAYDIWKQYELESYPGAANVDYYALFAFDATWILIQALQKLCSPMTHQSSTCLSLTNASYCFDRQLINSSSLFNIIDNNTFLGVSGHVGFNTNVTDRINGSYYIFKNVQDSSNGLNGVPVLVWSDSNNLTSYMQSSTIFWPGNRRSPPSGYAELSGIRLRIGVYQSPPLTIATKVLDESGREETKFVGYVPELIEHLQNRMKFIPNITLISPNVSYHGMIDAVANNEFDMVAADVTITAARTNKVAFSSSIFDNSLRIIIRKPSMNDVDLSYGLRPFSFQLWITFIAACIYASVLIYLLEREHNETLRDQSIFSSIVKCMWYTIGTVLGYGADFTLRTSAGRVLTVGLYILSLISIASYTAKLASDLTIARANGVISGIDDIKNGKLASSRIGIMINTSVEEYYLREISSNSQNYYQLKVIDELYDKLLNNIIDAAIMDSHVLEYFTNNVYCNLTLVGREFNKHTFGIVFQKNWIYQQSFDVNILSLRESGVLENLKRKWFEKYNCSHSSTNFNAMTIESMAGLFLTFGVISFLSLLLFIWMKRFIIKDSLLKRIHQKKSRKTVRPEQSDQ